MTDRVPKNHEQPATAPLPLDLAAKAREGLEQASRGQFVDGEEFFASWKARLIAATKDESAQGF